METKKKQMTAGPLLGQDPVTITPYVSQTRFDYLIQKDIPRQK